MVEWLSIPAIARSRGLKPQKVLAWVKSGELRACNMVQNTASRARWKVHRDDLAVFDLKRSNRASIPVSRPRRVTRSANGVIEFF